MTFSSLTPVSTPNGDHKALNKRLKPELEDVWINRDLSWLAFNERVLAEAADPRTPLLERTKFLAIFTSNLDEFFMKRVSALRAGETREQFAQFVRLRQRILSLLQKQADCYRQSITPGLAQHGIALCTWNDLTAAQQEEAAAHFDADISPALTPLVVHPERPFPFLSNLSTSWAFRLYDPERAERMMARLKIPSSLKQWIQLTADTDGGKSVFVPLHDLIRANVHKLYRGMTISGMTLIRITRDADVDLADSSEVQTRHQVEEQVRRRRFEPVVRLEFGPDLDYGIRDTLRERFELSSADV